MRNAITIALALSAVTLGCGSGHTPTLENANERIIGGTDDTGDPSVVQLRFTDAINGMSGCTASLIAPTVLLTAAHCVPHTAYQLQYNPSPSADTFDPKGQGWVDALSGVPHPDYDGDGSHGHDVGVVILATAPAGLAPLALGNAPAAGSSVRAVGYGLDAPPTPQGGQGGGTKRSIDITVDGVLPHEFTAGSDLHGTCHGDSGGPIFQGAAIVGTTSYGTTADCRQESHLMRVDDNLDFLSPYINGPGGSGGGGGGVPCCSNGAYYDCPSAAACGAGGDLLACIQGCGSDVNCILKCEQQPSGPDPSCTPDPTKDPTCP